MRQKNTGDQPLSQPINFYEKNMYGRRPTRTSFKNIGRSIATPKQRALQKYKALKQRQRDERRTFSNVQRSLNWRTGGYTGIELKFIDTVKTGTALGQSWTGGEYDPAANGLCCPTKGTGPSNRDGDHIVIKKIQIRGTVMMQIQSNQDDVAAPVDYAVMLVWDKQTNGAQLNAEDVMVSTDPEEFSYRNLQYSKRFRILKDWRGALHQTNAFTDGVNTGSTVGNSHHFQCILNVHIPVDFKGDAGSISDIVDNSLHIIACTSASGLYIAYHARVRFVG